MEEILFRFPMLGKEIFKKMDNKTLVECRKIDATWMGFIDNEKFRWNRIIEKYLDVQDCADMNFKNSWLKAIRRCNTKEVSKLAHSLYKFQKVRVSKTKSVSVNSLASPHVALSIDKYLFATQSDIVPMSFLKNVTSTT